MTNSKAIHELYEQCKTLNFDETSELIKKAESQEEKEFIRTVSNLILQQMSRGILKLPPTVK